MVGAAGFEPATSCSQSKKTILQPLILLAFFTFCMRFLRLLVVVFDPIHKHDPQA